MKSKQEQEAHERLREAVRDLSGERGMTADTIAASVEKLTLLLIANWKSICAAAHEEENGHTITVGMSLGLDFRSKATAGKASLGFSVKTRDSADFAVDDPDQTKLPLEVERRKKK